MPEVQCVGRSKEYQIDAFSNSLAAPVVGRCFFSSAFPGRSKKKPLNHFDRYQPRIVNHLAATQPIAGESKSIAFLPQAFPGFQSDRHFVDQLNMQTIPILDSISTGAGFCPSTVEWTENLLKKSLKCSCLRSARTLWSPSALRRSGSGVGKYRGIQGIPRISQE